MFAQIPTGQIAVMGMEAAALKQQQEQAARLPLWLLLGVAVAFLMFGKGKGARRWH